ncbi:MULTISPECIES: hypothetical protein [unclassified Acinetobacter]|uniref:hypothetical protein n=1 Tax=unclassified Acinetobacter TaxID=196816 RepID=UPI0029341952|nr:MULTISPECIES: hypothetical protein [unclassified Acinetobacter]WOE31626.1 hypothetical protein QSG84_15200 [Acinetobacter sp. SAAs470]WOE37091.1 hypothetical protein QSG86_08865 [Acinetobacter sp. SAAs474]
MKKNYLFFITLTASLFSSGCATTTLLNKDQHKSTSHTVQKLLLEDQVLAFGKPSQYIAELPADSIVIAGQKNSYVLTSGGTQFSQVLNTLDPKRIKVSKALAFHSEHNDGKFNGVLPLEYIMLSEDIQKKDREFFIENNARECTSSSDQRLNSQRFCLDIPLTGLVYPGANNRAALKPLSKAYNIRIYTQQQQQSSSSKQQNSGEKLLLFPFAVAFDVITLPIQAIHKIFD